jgi:hypothetical protein
LQRHEAGDRAEIIAEVQVPGRLDAGKYPLLELSNDACLTARAIDKRRVDAAGLWKGRPGKARVTYAGRVKLGCDS